MQQQELQIKQMEAQAKTQKMTADVELEKAKLELDRMKIESTERIAGAKIGSEVSQQQAERNAKQLMEGVKLGQKGTLDTADLNLREKESKVRNETNAHVQKLKDESQVKETKLKDETKLNKKE